MRTRDEDKQTRTQRIFVNVVSDKAILNFYDGFENFTNGRH